MSTSESDGPSVEKLAANEATAWEKSCYYENAEKLMWVFWNENQPFSVLFRQLDPTNLLELACGHGRHSEYILSKFDDKVKSLVMMDILQSNIDWCLNRIGPQEKVKFICNRGTGFQPVDDASITGIFCYDAMVHFHRDVVRSYLIDAQRVLVPEGKALLHHSNYAKDADTPFVKNPHCRAFMSAHLFRVYALEAGLEVLSQQVMPWGHDADLDCLTLLRKSK